MSRLHADAVKAAWEAEGLNVGDGRREHNPPCIVLYDLSTGDLDGTVGAPDRDVSWPFQGTCIGDTPEMARWVADKARDGLVGLTVSGRRVMRVVPEGGGPLTRDDDTADDPLFALTPRWRLFTTPA